MTTERPSLLDGDSPAGWPDQLKSILDRTLNVVRTAYNDGEHLTDAELEHALRLIRRIADELRVINSPDDVPF